MFRKLHEAIQKVSTKITGIDQMIEVKASRTDWQFERVNDRLDKIEIWAELAVDAKADEVAERFGELLKQEPKPVTSHTLKELVRQAVKGQ